MGLRRFFWNPLARLAFFTALALAMMAAIVSYIIFVTERLAGLHKYKAEYIIAREDALHGLSGEFHTFRRLADALFGAERAEAGGIVRDASFSLLALLSHAEGYSRSAEADPLRIDVGQHEKLAAKRMLVNHVLDAYDGMLAHNSALLLQGVLVGQPVTARPDALARLDSAETWLETLWALSRDARAGALAHIDSGMAEMRRALAFMGAAFAAVFSALAWLTWKMLYSLHRGARLYREKVRMEPGGGGRHGDIADMMADMAGSFLALVADINSVASQNKMGNAKARIGLAGLGGIYAVAADAINSLLDIIDRERGMNETRQMMFDAAPVVMTVFDKELNIIDCNQEGLRRYGFASKEEYAGNFFGASPKFQPDGKDSVEKGREAIVKCFRDGYASFEWMHQTLAGEPIPSEIICFPLTYNGADVMLSYAIDLRELKKSLDMARETEERTKLIVDLEKERALAAEENSKIKSRFLARMSHEIRTPIAAVLGISEIQLRGSGLGGEQEEAFAKIHSSASILLGIVNDILDLSKIEAGKMSVAQEKFGLAAMLCDVAQLNLALLGSKAINFAVDADETLPAEMYGDELRLKQALNNLLSNAFKYTSAGTVELKVLDDGEKETGSRDLRFVISDTGCGMTEQQLAALFDEYARFTENDEKPQAGTGLGMPITKSLVGLMGGTIDVSSSFGVGTRVSVALRLKDAGSGPIGTAAARDIREFKMDSGSIRKKMSFVPEPMPYGRVLVVDDVDTNLYVARGLMQVYELQVETCDSGYEAIERLRRGEAYDVVFMDHMMPGMDGVETTKAIREMGYAAPIVALTANALIGQAEEYARRGFDGFISKPIQATPLDACLNKFVKGRHRPDGASGTDFAGFDGRGGEPEEFAASEEMMREIREDFLETQRGAREEIAAAMEAGEHRAAARLSHNLKNLAAMLGDKKLAAAAGDAEKRLLDSLPVPDGLMEALGNELQRAVAETEGLLNERGG